MKNEYGESLDRNGYAPSIVQRDMSVCFFCGRNGNSDKLDRHECFNASNRAKSKELGLWVLLCHARCHQSGDNAVHKNALMRNSLCAQAQRRAMEAYGWDTDEFIRQFGRSYL